MVDNFTFCNNILLLRFCDEILSATLKEDESIQNFISGMAIEDVVSAKIVYEKFSARK